MKKFAVAALASVLVALPAVAQEASVDAAAAPAPTAASAPAAAPVTVKTGKFLFVAGGSRAGSIVRVAADGSPVIIMDGRTITVPASTLSDANGKLTTSLTKREVRALR